MLEDGRNGIRQSLLQLVIEEPTDQCWDCFCGLFSKQYLAYIHSLRSEKLPGDIFEVAVSKAIQAVDKLREPEPEYTDLTDRSCPDHGNHRGTSDFVTNLRKRVERVGLTKPGLCLDCVRLGSGNQHEMHAARG